MYRSTPTVRAAAGADRLRKLLWQQLYRLAYLGIRCFWFLFRPKGSGTLVAIWWENRLLLVKNGYRRAYSLPGGNRRAGEPARRAAVREVAEEVGIRLFPNQLHYCGTLVSHLDYVRDHCAYYEVRLRTPPRIRIDGREVVAARFVAPAQLSAYPLTVQAEAYLKRFGREADPRAQSPSHPGPPKR
ncbi:MAG: NUDIX hydrolase [Desulfosarcinaceae bacterium]|nr:NUDIX hydrolase [Desulfosarcinaceae bacterium]